MHDLLRRFCFALEPPRAVVVAAHYDDEAIGLGAQFGRLRDALWTHVTNSAPRDDADARAAGFANGTAYGKARSEEFGRALQRANVEDARRICIGVTDGEAAFHLADVSARLVELLSGEEAERAPEIVITHPYEGGHPDHDATAFCVAMACRALGKSAPLRLEMTSYHKGPNGLRTGAFLPSPNEVVVLELSPAQRDFKRELFACYASQFDVLRHFSVEVEAFRLAPDHDFSKPPHDSTLHYEGQSWGANLTGARLCELMRHSGLMSSGLM